MAGILSKMRPSHRVYALGLLFLLLFGYLPAVRPVLASAVLDGGFEGISCTPGGSVTPGQCGAWTLLGLNGLGGITTTEQHSGTSSFYFSEGPGGFGAIIRQGIGVVSSQEVLAFWLKGAIPFDGVFAYTIQSTSGSPII